MELIKKYLQVYEPGTTLKERLNHLVNMDEVKMRVVNATQCIFRRRNQPWGDYVAEIKDAVDRSLKDFEHLDHMEIEFYFNGPSLQARIGYREDGSGQIRWRSQ
jgi:hypothetical protein